MKDKLFIEATITSEHKSTTCKIFTTQTEIFKVLGHLIWDCENTQVISWSRVDNKFVSGNIIYKWGQKKKKNVDSPMGKITGFRQLSPSVT